jgi:hypothetical protein
MDGSMTGMEKKGRRHVGLSALFLTALLALLPAACGPERDRIDTPYQSQAAVLAP